MEVNVSMTAEDFMDFMKWKQDKKVYEYRMRKVVKNVEHLVSSVHKALVECGKPDEPEYKIESQNAANALVEEAAEILRKI